MNGWRARIGVLVPPGNPNLEPELMQLMPAGVSLHFTRMVAHGETGSHTGQEERNRTQIAHLDDNVALLNHVKPDVIVLAHTATSYTLGMQGEAELITRIEKTTGARFITAFGSVVSAFAHLGVQRIALGAPYNAVSTAKSKAHLEAHGLSVVNHAHLEGISNIYDLTAADAYRLARRVDVPSAQAVFLSGVGMPTIDALQALETDLGKPCLSSTAAMFWNALRQIGVHVPIAGFGRLLAGS